MYLTAHSQDRIRERCGLPKSSAEKLVAKALTDGIPHKDTAGRLNRYITSLYLKERSANNIRIYHRFIYIFHAETLITVFPLPNEFHRTEDKLKQKKAK